MSFQSRLPNVGTSIFTVMSHMALEHGAINLSQGFPDFAVAPELINLINHYMLAGHNQYAPMPGTPALRKAIAEVVEKTYQRPTDFETEVTICAGGTEAIFASIAALVQAGDDVILFDPAYDSYDPAVRLNGGTPIHLKLHPPDFQIDWDQVRRVITSRTRMIMINSPHNPTGAVLSESDLKNLEKIVTENDILVLSDEVYERIIFDDYAHQSVLKFPTLAARSIAVFSFGKTFHATGWKVGYTVASESLTREIRKTHQFITFSVNTPVQTGVCRVPCQSRNLPASGEILSTETGFFPPTNCWKFVQAIALSWKLLSTAIL